MNTCSEDDEEPQTISQNGRFRTTLTCPYCDGIWDMVPIFDRHCCAAFGMCQQCEAIAMTDFDYSKPSDAIKALRAKIALWNVYTETQRGS